MKTVEAFRRAIGSIRTNYVKLFIAATILVAILIVYRQDLSILANEAIQNEASNYVILIPFLVSYLVYSKREAVRGALESEKISKTSRLFLFLEEAVGLALVLAAFLFYWYGSYTFYPLEYHLLSLPLFIAGTVLLLFNLKLVIALVFPIAFLLFLVPFPSAITYEAGGILGNFNTQAACAILKAFGLPVGLQSIYGAPTIVINTSSGTPILFSVDLPCSGIYSLIAFAIFATFLVYIVKGPIAKRLILFPVGFLILTILNILRLSLLASIAYQFGEDIAMTIFHTVSGWILIFIGMMLLLLMSEKLLHLTIFESTNKTASCPKCNGTEKNNSSFCTYCGKLLKESQRQPPKAFWTKIISLILLSLVFTLSIQAPVFAFAQGLTITNTSPEKNTDVFPQVPNYQLKFLYRDQEYEEIAGQDASLMYAYIPQNVSNPTVYVLVGVANSINNLHSWEVCLVTYQIAQGKAPLVNVLESKDIQIMQNPPIIASYFTFQQPSNDTQITLYWFQKVLFQTGTTIESKYVRISLIILTPNPSGSDKYEQKLQSMATNITELWEPLEKQSLISLGIPAIQALLGATVLFAIFAPAVQYAQKSRKKTTNLKIFEKLASPQEKLLYQTVKELSQKTKETTTQNIASTFEKTVGKTVKLNELNEMLNNLEKHGIIKEDIVNILDQPKLVWKP